MVVPKTYGPTHNHRHLTLLAVDEHTEAGAREWDALRDRDAGLRACKSAGEAREWVKRSLAEELSKAPSDSLVIFSSEQLSQRLLTRDEVVRLRRALEELGLRTVRVVVYLREQVGLSLSWESMELIAGHHTRAPYSIFDHQKLLERWEYAWGRETLVARTFAKRHLEKGDVVQDFAKNAVLLSGEFFKIEGQIRRNRRLGMEGASLLRMSNHWLPNGLPKQIVKACRSTILEISMQNWLNRNPMQASPSEIRALEIQFASSNRWVDKHYGTHLEESFGTT